MDKSIYLIDDALWKVFVYVSSKNLNKSFDDIIDSERYFLLDDIIGDYFSDLLNDYDDLSKYSYFAFLGYNDNPFMMNFTNLGQDEDYSVAEFVTSTCNMFYVLGDNLIEYRIYADDLLARYGDVIPNQYKVLMRNVHSLN